MTQGKGGAPADDILSMMSGRGGNIEEQIMRRIEMKEGTASQAFL